jgi:hypothetical protein
VGPAKIAVAGLFAELASELDKDGAEIGREDRKLGGNVTSNCHDWILVYAKENYKGYLRNYPKG